MTEAATTPEDEAKATARRQYAMVVAQQGEYGWEPKILDVGDYLVIFVRVAKPAGRTFLMRLRCDDYPRASRATGITTPQAGTAGGATRRPTTIRCISSS